TCVGAPLPGADTVGSEHRTGPRGAAAVLLANGGLEHRAPRERALHGQSPLCIRSRSHGDRPPPPARLARHLSCPRQSTGQPCPTTTPLVSGNSSNCWMKSPPTARECVSTSNTHSGGTPS